MIYEMRTYEAMPGELRALVVRFADVTHPLFVEHGFRPIAHGTEAVGDNNKLHHLHRTLGALCGGGEHPERSLRWKARAPGGIPIADATEALNRGVDVAAV